MASPSMERVDAEQSANALFEMSLSRRRQSQEFAEHCSVRGFGAIGGFVLALLFEGVIAIIGITLFTWIH